MKTELETTQVSNKQCISKEAMALPEEERTRQRNSTVLIHTKRTIPKNGPQVKKRRRKDSGCILSFLYHVKGKAMEIKIHLITQGCVQRERHKRTFWCCRYILIYTLTEVVVMRLCVCAKTY